MEIKYSKSHQTTQVKSARETKVNQPVKNAFTFAQELATKYKWPTFVFNGKVYTPYPSYDLT